MKNKIKEHLEFSKRELNGLLILFLLIFLIAIAPYIYIYFQPPGVYDYSEFKKEVELFRASATEKKYYKSFQQTEGGFNDEKVTSALFSFNPNNLSTDDWKRLGLSERQIKIIKNYESKGGKFYKKEDLKKIYSITPEDYTRLESFISIPERSSYGQNFKHEFKKVAASHIAMVDINTADSAALESLNGIGPAFASRILKYRARLGGFHKKEQLKEVYGIDSAVYNKLQQYIVINQTGIKQIAINTATFDDLKKHPYLSYKQMNAILKYRKQHGNYKSISDMKAIVLLDDNLLSKMAPYLTF